jgi:hypothetical protein
VASVETRTESTIAECRAGGLVVAVKLLVACLALFSRLRALAWDLAAFLSALRLSRSALRCALRWLRSALRCVLPGLGLFVWD